MPDREMPVLEARANEILVNLRRASRSTHAESVKAALTGFESLASHLGLIAESAEQRSNRALSQLLGEIDAALDLSRAEGRSRVCELLEPTEDPRLEYLRELADEVSQGALEWSVFQVRVRQVVRRLRQLHLSH